MKNKAQSTVRIYELLFDAKVDGPLPLRERSKINKLDQILQAARELFARVDYEAVKMDDIAERAEVSKGTLYSYFATKETVLVALFAQAQDQIDASRAAFLRDCDVRQPVATMVRYEELLNEMGAALFPIGLWRIVYAARVSNRALKPGLLLASISESIMDDRREMLSRMIAAGALREDLDVPSVSRVLQAVGRLHWEDYISDPEPDLARTNANNAADIANVLAPYVRLPQT